MSLNPFKFALLGLLLIPSVAFAVPGYEAATFDLNVAPDVNGIYCPNGDSFNGLPVYQFDNLGTSTYLFYGDFAGADEYWFLGTAVETYGTGANMRFFDSTNPNQPDPTLGTYSAIGPYPDSGVVTNYDCTEDEPTGTTTELAVLTTISYGIGALLSILGFFIAWFVWNRFKLTPKWKK